MDNPFKSPAILSFCPGILGIERGLARAGVNCRVSAYVEIEAFICANLVAGMEAGILDPAPIWTDAKTFDARPFRGKIHGIIGGYPCPGESLAGLREGHLYKGFIWPYIRKAIAAARPLFCFFENVDDHLTGTYPIVLRSLQNMGYAVEAGIYSAEEAGAPHERQRLFILAILADLQIKREWELSECKQGQKWSKQGYNINTDWICKNLVNSESTGERRETRDLHTENGGQNRKLPFEFNSSSEELGNTASQRLKGGFEKENSKRRPGSRGMQASWYGANEWPAGPGTHQHEWEEPRTIKSGLGSTIDGYNFREDLLRAIGNSVVEQTAEIAFKDLLKKHMNGLWGSVLKV